MQNIREFRRRKYRTNFYFCLFLHLNLVFNVRPLYIDSLELQERLTVYQNTFGIVVFRQKLIQI